MKTFAFIILMMICFGCARKTPTQSPHRESISGTWTATVISNNVTFYLSETNGAIEGAVSFDNSPILPHKIRGVFSGSLAVLYYDLNRKRANTDYEIRQAITIEAHLNGSKMSGVVTSFKGLGRYVYPFQGSKSDDLADAPPTDREEEPIIDPPIPKTAEEIAHEKKEAEDAAALDQSLKDLTNAFAAEHEAMTNLIKSIPSSPVAIPRYSYKTPTVQGIPSSIYLAIRSNAEAQWPGDFEMQKYVIEKQVKAYRELHP